MSEEMEEIAKLFGAKIVGKVPDVGGGVLGASHVAKVYESRMQELRETKAPAERSKKLEIVVDESVYRALQVSARSAGASEVELSPEQLVALLLAHMTVNVQEHTIRIASEISIPAKPAADAEAD